jgi:hypothetical protein
MQSVIWSEFFTCSVVCYCEHSVKCSDFNNMREVTYQRGKSRLLVLVLAFVIFGGFVADCGHRIPEDSCALKDSPFV